jgi:hypothetical protein
MRLADDVTPKDPIFSMILGGLPEDKAILILVFLMSQKECLQNQSYKNHYAYNRFHIYSTPFLDFMFFVKERLHRLCQMLKFEYKQKIINRKYGKISITYDSTGLMTLENLMF